MEKVRLAFGVLASFGAVISLIDATSSLTHDEPKVAIRAFTAAAWAISALIWSLK